jgi:hypothetical protein
MVGTGQIFSRQLDDPQSKCAAFFFSEDAYLVVTLALSINNYHTS